MGDGYLVDAPVDTPVDTSVDTSVDTPVDILRQTSPRGDPPVYIVHSEAYNLRVEKQLLACSGVFSTRVVIAGDIHTHVFYPESISYGKLNETNIIDSFNIS